MVTLVPWLAGHIDALTSFDDVKLLDVQLNRLRRWYTDGLLLIGDAAHAMSPVGGVGINLAVADAVAAAGASGRPAAPRHRLHQAVGSCPGAAMAACRADPVRAAADPQPGHRGRRFGRSTALNRRLLVRIADKVPALRTAAGYAIAIGPLPEHVPEFARR